MADEQDVAEKIKPTDADADAAPDGSDAGRDEAGAEAEADQGSDAAETLADAANRPDDKSKEPAKADWPDDWREKLAGGDEKLLKQLRRYQSLKAWSDAGVAARQKISSGEYRAPLPKDASDDQVKAWRAENGIPETPEGYLEALPDGLNIGEDDKPIIGKFAQEMHGLNASPEVVGKAVDWYFREQEAQAAAQKEADKKAMRDAEDELRAEWGAEYRSNINALNNWLDGAPEGLKDNILSARLGDGTILGNNPAAVRWLTSLAAEMNPGGTIAPGSGMSNAESVESEIARLEKLMRTDRKAYQKEEGKYLQLLEARAKLKKRA